ncbi:LON domain serine protease [Rhizoctonia solani]|uniref:LON domain serine protease n=1 Tax=Rhizoctonia solani TaxID=456999 RepID=A0A8H8SRC9_9AGAM|nr:LON domain serine protease [Rhizoctonia solani]QRW15596.1 LON domain serine protease [Rhizoctonia solani]
MATMQGKYKAQLAGLKELHKVAPRCLRQLQMEWQDYIVEYLGALFVPEGNSNAGLCSTRICLDTPKPEDCNTISTDKMETHLFKNA